MQQRVAGKTYVVTGASSGIGRRVAELQGTLHASVLLAARREDVFNDVAANIKKSVGHALLVPTDVGNPADMERLSNLSVEQFGKNDVWINNAGVGTFIRFEDAQMKDNWRLNYVNFKGVVYGSQLAVRQFRKQGYGTH